MLISVVSSGVNDCGIKNRIYMLNATIDKHVGHLSMRKFIAQKCKSAAKFRKST